MQFPCRVFMDVEVGVVVKVLDLVGPWFQFSVLEDGWGHDQSTYDKTEGSNVHQPHLNFSGKE